MIAFSRFEEICSVAITVDIEITVHEEKMIRTKLYTVTYSLHYLCFIYVGAGYGMWTKNLI